MTNEAVILTEDPGRRNMLQPEDLLAAGLTELSEDDDRLQPPDETTAAPVDPQLQLLPYIDTGSRRSELGE